MSFKINFSESSLNKNLYNFEDKIKFATKMYALTKAEQITSSMKKNRKWVDRTGMAKIRLSTSVVEENNLVRMILSHGVSYGIWLELANEKNYAIILPTINEEGPHIVNDLQAIFNKIKFWGFDNGRK